MNYIMQYADAHRLTTVTSSRWMVLHATGLQMSRCPKAHISLGGGRVEVRQMVQQQDGKESGSRLGGGGFVGNSTCQIQTPFPELVCFQGSMQNCANWQAAISLSWDKETNVP